MRRDYNHTMTVSIITLYSARNICIKYVRLFIVTSFRDLWWRRTESKSTSFSQKQNYDVFQLRRWRETKKSNFTINCNRGVSIRPICTRFNGPLSNFYDCSTDQTFSTCHTSVEHLSPETGKMSPVKRRSSRNKLNNKDDDDTDTFPLTSSASGKRSSSAATSTKHHVVTPSGPQKKVQRSAAVSARSACISKKKIPAIDLQVS